MTARDFREIALSLPEAVGAAHMSHPDFRVDGRIFATLGYPDEEWGMIKLTLEEQGRFVQANPDMFRPVKGAWGRRGNTNVYLPDAEIHKVCEALCVAWRNTAPKRLVRREPSR
jgi:hypothetical protein